MAPAGVNSAHNVGWRRPGPRSKVYASIPTAILSVYEEYPDIGSNETDGDVRIGGVVMSSDRKRIAFYPDDAAFLRVVCDELRLDRAKAVTRIFEDYRKWEAVDNKPSSFMQFSPSTPLQRVSVYPRDAEFVRELCDDMGVSQPEAVACIFEGFRDWIAMDATVKATITDEKVAEVQADIRAKLDGPRNA